MLPTCVSLCAIRLMDLPAQGCGHLLCQSHLLVPHRNGPDIQSRMQSPGCNKSKLVSFHEYVFMICVTIGVVDSAYTRNSILTRNLEPRSIMFSKVDELFRVGKFEKHTEKPAKSLACIKQYININIHQLCNANIEKQVTVWWCILMLFVSKHVHQNKQKLLYLDSSFRQGDDEALHPGHRDAEMSRQWTMCKHCLNVVRRWFNNFI